MQRARSAQFVWTCHPVSERVATLGRLRLLIARDMDAIVETIVRDTGKPPHDALAGDLMVTLEQLRFNERHASRLLKRRKLAKPAFLFSKCAFYEEFEPHGVVLVFAPYNYPLQLALIPMATALAAGNAVLLKCSEKAPAVAALIDRLCKEAAFPPNLVQVISDPPEQADELLSARPDFVFFTGSTLRGRTIAERAASYLIPCILELGGKDPAIVFADCDLDRTVEGIVYGAFANAGQVCVGIKRLYIEHSIYETFLAKLIERVSALRIGSSQEDDIGVLSQEAQQVLKEQVEQAVQAGAVVCWPDSGVVNGGTPIILSQVSRDSRLMQDDSFGPVLCIGTFQSPAEAIELANASSFALGASIWTRDLSRGQAIASELSAGTCTINDAIRAVGNPCAGFGGNRLSGYGRYRGPQGLYAFSRTKTVMTSGSRSRNLNHWFPFSRKNYAALRFFLALRHARPQSLIRLFRSLVSATPLLFAFAAFSQTKPSDLKIVISAPMHSHGPIAYLVFASAEGFPNQKAQAIKSGFISLDPIRHGATVDVGPLPPGRYAVSAYQDVNGNGRLDTGLFGIPSEPVGTSNNPKAHMGPPTFDECAFTLGPAGRTVPIRLMH